MSFTHEQKLTALRAAKGPWDIGKFGETGEMMQDKLDAIIVDLEHLPALVSLLEASDVPAMCAHDGCGTCNAWRAALLHFGEA